LRRLRSGGVWHSSRLPARSLLLTKSSTGMRQRWRPSIQIVRLSCPGARHHAAAKARPCVRVHPGTITRHGTAVPANLGKSPSATASPQPTQPRRSVSEYPVSTQ
jgi:hypothetical protein